MRRLLCLPGMVVLQLGVQTLQPPALHSVPDANSALVLLHKTACCQRQGTFPAESRW